jgi:hypothetical protein
MTHRHAVLLPAVALCIFAEAGCGSAGAPAASGSREEATVKGIVRVRGKKAAEGLVSFRASNVNRPDVQLREAKIEKDGSYTIKTLVGQNFVAVTCKELYAPKNRDLLENERLVEIKSGENALDLDIPPN